MQFIVEIPNNYMADTDSGTVLLKNLKLMGELIVHMNGSAMTGSYEKALTEMLEDAFTKAEPIAKNGTRTTLLIDIPRDYVRSFQRDRFSGNIRRISADTRSLQEEGRLMGGTSIMLTLQMLETAFEGARITDAVRKKGKTQEGQDAAR